MNKFKDNTQSCSSNYWEKKSIKELFSKSYYHCTATFEKLKETKNQAQNLTSFEAKCWNIEETPEEDILMKDHCDSNQQQTKNNLTFSYIADSMIKEKPDQWVFSASLKNKVVQIKCADINIDLDYEEIFLNSFFIQCSRLKLINFCCCTKNTLDALNSAMNAPLQSNTKYCFEQVEFETSEHLCSRNDYLTNLKSEFVSSVKGKFIILQNDCFENLKKIFKISKIHSKLSTIREFVSISQINKVIEIKKIRYNNNNSNELKSIPENFMIFESEIKKKLQEYIGCSVFANLNSQNILPDVEGDNCSISSSQDRKIKLVIVPMIFLTLSQDEYLLNNEDEYSTIYFKNQDLLSKMQSNEDEKFQISTHNLKINYFVEQIKRVKSISSIEINYIFNLSPQSSLFKCNADTINIDLRSESYNIDLKATTNIKILILSFKNILGFNKLIKNKMVFDPKLENLNEDFAYVPAYSLCKFLVNSNLINSLDIIFISNDAEIDIEFFSKLIYAHSERSKLIGIQRFKSANESNSEESKSSIQSSNNNQKTISSKHIHNRSISK